MATKKNLSATVRENIPFIIHQNEAPMNKSELRKAYVALEGCSDEHDFGTNKDTWSKLKSAIHGAAPKLVKEGILFKPSKGKFDLVQGATIPSAFVPFLNGLSAPPVVSAPVVEVEPMIEVQEPMIEVSVSNPAVIEAHIDTETQELVENVGGSRDYRKPLDQVEDGYITSSSVQVSTTTLEPVVEVEVASVEVSQEELDRELEEAYEEGIGFSEEANLMDLPVEVEVASVDPVEVQEVVEPTLEIEMPVEDNTEVEEDEVDNQPRYDLKELRKSASFDPLSITLKGVKGSYEVYRDMEARMVVLTQKGREDYVMIPVDVDMERLEGIDPRYAKFAKQAITDFTNEGNHKVGCTRMCKALLSCCKMCQHTDDFGGLVEFCIDSNCPLQTIWGGEATYVNPEAS